MPQFVIKHLNIHLKDRGEWAVKLNNETKNELDEILKKLDEAEKEFKEKMNECKLDEVLKKDDES